MKPPTDSPSPKPGGDRGPERASAEQVEAARKTVKRPGGHTSYRLGGEPAIGHRWHEAPPPALDDGVPQRDHDPDEEDLLDNEDVDHEHRDVNIRAVIGSAIVLTVVVLGSQLLMWLLFGFFESQAAAHDPQISPLAAAPADMPKTTRESPFFNPNVSGPSLMTNEPMGLANLRGEEQKRLHGYGWVNQASGVAFIPIDEAKKLVRERGLPVREGEPVAPTVGTRLPARGEASGGRIITMTPSEEPPATPPAAPAPGEKPQGEPAAKPHGPGGH